MCSSVFLPGRSQDHRKMNIQKDHRRAGPKLHQISPFKETKAVPKKKYVLVHENRLIQMVGVHT